MFELTPTPSAKPSLRLWPGLAGLLAAGFIASGIALPRERILSWTQLLLFACGRILATSVAGTVTTAVLFAISSRKGSSEIDRLLVQVSLISAWLTPLVLFIRESSLWTLLIASIVAPGVTQTLQAYSSPPGAVEPLILSLHPDTLPLGSHFNRQLSVAAALLAQSGALAVLTGYPLASALLAGIGFGFWTWSFGLYAHHRDRPAPLPQSRSAPAVALAVFFTAVALIPFVRIPGGIGSSPRRPWDLFPHQRGSGGPHPRPAVSGDEGTARGSPGNYGILLWPEKQIYTKLVAPAPSLESGPHTFRRNTNPLIIPFNGVYWFFKAPDRQPPGNSRQAKASPDKVLIRSTDHRPLSIEAHDHLANLIDLHCCSRVQIAIRNADRYPDTVSLELILINSSLPLKPFESLGRMTVKSTRPWSLYKERPVTDEILNFAIPSRPSLGRFDEVRIIFRLDPARADTAARIAIDHLVLVPRGL